MAPGLVSDLCVVPSTSSMCASRSPGTKEDLNSPTSPFLRSSSRRLTHLKDSFLSLPKATRSPRSTSTDSDTWLPPLTALSFWEILRPARFLNSHGEEVVMRSMTSPTQISAWSSTPESSLSLSTVSTRSSEPAEPRIWAQI